MDIYVTLDYELFLNDISGDPRNCLIIPGNKFLDICDRQGIKATFFVDAAYLYRLNELKDTFPQLSQDFQDVSTQIADIVRRNHSIGLHIHSQWYYSNFDGRKWSIDFKHYKLSDMPQKEADEKFQSSFDLLKSISGATIKSFRGGGFSIQDYKSFPEIMLRNGITIDSTATYKGKLISDLQSFDYSSLKSSDHYRFETDILKSVSDGRMIEFPITSAKEPYLTYCYKRYKYHCSEGNSNYGNGGDLPLKTRIGFIKNIFKKFGFTIYVGASIDYQSFFHLTYVAEKIKKQGKRDLIILGHPKNFSPASLDYFERFVVKMKEEHKFKTM